jgi:thiamine-monophosphate kinase
MSGVEPGEAGDEAGPVDEFDWIERCLRPLARGAPEALGLLDDAAVIPARPGFDLVVTKDAIVEGVHFLSSDPLDLVARKLLRVNLSDLAGKGAEPYGYLLAIAWPPGGGWAARRAFAAGLRTDQDAFSLRLFGGDTASTPGPLAASVTMFGWVPAGSMVPRGGARPGDVIMVTGTIGDGWLGLAAARGELADLPTANRDWLADRYRLPQPRLDLAEALRRNASAAADVSDGLVADAGHIAEASAVGVELDLDALPLSAAARAWLGGQTDTTAARAALASGGDDYEVVCAVRPDAVDALRRAADGIGLALTAVGRVQAGTGVAVLSQGREVALARRGWRHGGAG